MHREEREQWIACSLCGDVIEPAAGQGFPLGEGAALCWECAIRRGGVYDADEDRWTTPPDVSGLADERRPPS